MARWVAGVVLAPSEEDRAGARTQPSDLGRIPARPGPRDPGLRLLHRHHPQRCDAVRLRRHRARKPPHPHPRRDRPPQAVPDQVPGGGAGILKVHDHVPCAPGDPVRSASSQTPAGLAHQIREGLDDFPRLHLNIRTSRTFINETGKSWPGDYGRVLGVPGDPIFRIANWRNSGVYSISFDGQFPRFFNFLPTGLSQLPPSLGPLISIIEAPGRSGLLITLITSAALAEDLRSPAGGGDNPSVQGAGRRSTDFVIGRRTGLSGASPEPRSTA